MKRELIAILLALIYFQISYSSVLQRRFDKFSYLKDWFCSGDDEECERGCCKGFVCMDYLEEGEKCLFKHKLKVGCGCRPGLKCAFQSWDLFVCVDPDSSNLAQEMEEREINRKFMDRNNFANEKKYADSFDFHKSKREEKFTLNEKENDLPSKREFSSTEFMKKDFGKKADSKYLDNENLIDIEE